MSSRTAQRAAGLFLVLASTACTIDIDHRSMMERVERRYSVKGQPSVSLITFDGEIEIRSWDRDEVLVEVEKRGSTQDLIDSIEVAAGEEDGRIRVEARVPTGRSPMFGINVSRSAKLIASVPRKADLLARTGDGSVLAERIGGRLELRTGDGTITGIDLTGDLTINTGDGSVKLDAVDGRVDASTGDGGISLGGKFEAVRLRTGDGSIALRIEAGSTMNEDWEISTGDGGVVVYLPADLGAELDVRTGDGIVRTDDDLGLTPEGEVTRRSVRGRLGSGGRLLRVRTGDGSISLRSAGDGRPIQVER
jgi:hypothetical protein